MIGRTHICGLYLRFLFESLKNVPICQKGEKERREVTMAGNKNMRRLSVLVTAQTLYNLDKLARMAQVKNVGRVIDKLTREKMIALREVERDAVQ